MTDIENVVATERERCLKILRDLLDQAEECEAAAGTIATAEEALTWAIGEITRLPAGDTSSPAIRPSHQQPATPLVLVRFLRRDPSPAGSCPAPSLV
jgi:hypothetical protein